MKKKEQGLAFLGVLALLSPLALSNAPAPTYPEISHDDYDYSCQMSYLGSGDSSYYYSFSITNNTDYDIEPDGIIAKSGDTTMKSSYSLSGLFVPRHTQSLPSVVRLFSATFWVGDTPSDLSLSLTGALSQGAITEEGIDSFASANPVLSISQEGNKPSRCLAVTSFADVSAYDNLSSYYVREYAYKDGSVLSFYGYHSASETSTTSLYSQELANPETAFAESDFTYRKTYRLALDPNKTHTVPSNYSGFSGVLLTILLFCLVLGVVIGISAVVIVAMVKVCQHA
jgi:hypothetical protein